MKNSSPYLNKFLKSLNEEEQMIKRMTVKEFRDKGFLQEVNRQFFHPLGLALEVIVKCEEMPLAGDTGEMLFGGILDYRDNPEGMLFASGVLDMLKAREVDQEKQAHLKYRFQTGQCDINGIQTIKGKENETD